MAISHHIRTPLASIRAMVEAIDDGVVTDAETIQRYVRNVLGEVHRLSGLIDDLFELWRLDAGALTLHLEPGSRHDLVSDTLEAIQVQAIEKGLHLRGAVAGDLPQPTAAGSGRRASLARAPASASCCRRRLHDESAVCGHPGPRHGV